MVWSKIFDVNIHALHLNCTPEEFGKEWRECTLDHERDLTLAITMLEPFLQHWISLLTDYEYPKDTQIQALCNALNQDVDYAGMSRARKWAKTRDDLYSELAYAAVRLLRRRDYFPSHAKGTKIEYVFAFFYRQELYTHIIHAHHRPLEYTDDDKLLCSEAVDPIEEDVLLLKHCVKSRWQKYLLYLLYNGFSALEIAEITRLPRETFYYEELELWDKIRTLWQTPEQ